MQQLSRIFNLSAAARQSLAEVPAYVSVWGLNMGRLRWLCRRGTKELDLLTCRYLDNFYASADQRQQQAFREMLQLPDPELHALLTGCQVSKDDAVRDIVAAVSGRCTVGDEA